jgi:hypothetical protein
VLDDLDGSAALDPSDPMLCFAARTITLPFPATSITVIRDYVDLCGPEAPREYAGKFL